jgi:hypothetical protein
MNKSFPILGAILLAVGAPAQTQSSSTGSAQPLTLQEAVGWHSRRTPES